MHPLLRILALARLPRWLKAVLALGAVGGTTLGVLGGLSYRRYREPSLSMWPTLMVGESFFAKRGAPPERGTVVVFRYPEQPSNAFVKRVIGLPGDVVAFPRGELEINGWAVPRCVVGKRGYVDDVTGETHTGTLVVEHLGPGSYLVFEDEAARRDGERRWTVAPGEYFVLGDNRGNSHDSRFWRRNEGGGVPFANTLGGVRGHDLATLPKGMEGAAALATCLASRPPQTSPPPPR
jgi:signal peptidase I